MAETAQPVQQPDLHSPSVIRCFVKDVVGRFPRNTQLYNECFCHKSMTGHPSNERLECLGDAVLGMIACEYLFMLYKDVNEGVLSRLRMKLVNSTAIAEFSSSLNLDKMILMSPPVQKGRCKIFQDVFEAFVGALYLDMGYNVVSDWCKLLFAEHFPPSRLWNDSNYKDILNKLQKQLHCNVQYVRKGTCGSAHAVTYMVQVIAGHQTAMGTGRTVKLAEQDASLTLLRQLGLTSFVTGTNTRICHPGEENTGRGLVKSE